MLEYVIRRTVAIALMASSIITFLLFFAIPRDPARLTCGKNCTPTLRAQNRHVLGYDKPIATQYVDFLKGFVVDRKFPDDPQLERTNPQNIVHCNAPCLGYSPRQQTTINNVLGKAAPITVSIALGSFVLWVGVGVALGVISALRRGKIVDRVLLGVSLIGYSFPTFFVGLIILQFVTIKYHVLPEPNYVSPFKDPVGWASDPLVADHDCPRQILFLAAGFGLRYLWPAELDLMAELADLAPDSRWGGWYGEPVTCGGPVVSVFRS